MDSKDGLRDGHLFVHCAEHLPDQVTFPLDALDAWAKQVEIRNRSTELGGLPLRAELAETLPDDGFLGEETQQRGRQ